MLYWGIVYNHQKVIPKCPFTNMNVIDAVNLLKKWSAILKPIKSLPAPSAPARIPIRKCRSLPPLGLQVEERQVQPAAVAVLPEVSPEPDDSNPTVRRIYMKDKKI
jgi:hypothetical protein